MYFQSRRQGPTFLSQLLKFPKFRRGTLSFLQFYNQLFFSPALSRREDFLSLPLARGQNQPWDLFFCRRRHFFRGKEAPSIIQQGFRLLHPVRAARVSFRKKSLATNYSFMQFACLLKSTKQLLKILSRLGEILTYVLRIVILAYDCRSRGNISFLNKSSRITKYNSWKIYGKFLINYGFIPLNFRASKRYTCVEIQIFYTSLI